MANFSQKVPFLGDVSCFYVFVQSCPLTSWQNWEWDARKMVWISGWVTEESLGSEVRWEAPNDGRTQPTNKMQQVEICNFVNWIGIWKSKYMPIWTLPCDIAHPSAAWKGPIKCPVNVLDLWDVSWFKLLLVCLFAHIIWSPSQLIPSVDWSFVDWFSVD